MLMVSALVLLGCGQSDAEAWAAFCDAPSACERPADLSDIADEARSAREQYIVCVMEQARSAVDNESVRSAYLGAIGDGDLDRIDEARRAAGVGSCPMLDLMREDP